MNEPTNTTDPAAKQADTTPQTMQNREVHAEAAFLRDLEKMRDNYHILTVAKAQSPQGAKLVEAWDTGSHFVILGTPNDCEDENNPEYHNCDAMGCGSVEHVVARVPKSLPDPQIRIADLERQLSEIRTSFEGLVVACENADETGYVTDAGFISDETLKACREVINSSADIAGKWVRKEDMTAACDAARNSVAVLEAERDQLREQLAEAKRERDSARENGRSLYHGMVEVLNALAFVDDGAGPNTAVALAQKAAAIAKERNYRIAQLNEALNAYEEQVQSLEADLTAARKQVEEMREAALLLQWIIPPAIKDVETALGDSDATEDIIHVLAALRSLAQSTKDHAEFVEADGFTLTAEETRHRADRYQESYEAVLKIWADAATSDDVTSVTDRFESKLTIWIGRAAICFGWLRRPGNTTAQHESAVKP